MSSRYDRTHARSLAFFAWSLLALTLCPASRAQISSVDDLSKREQTARTHADILVRNAAKRTYEARGTDLDRLSRFNEKNF